MITDDDDPIDAYIEENYKTSYEGKPRNHVGKDIAFNRHSFGHKEIQNPDQGAVYTGLDGLHVTLEQDFDDDQVRHLFSYAINASRGIDPNNPPSPVDWEEMMKGGLQTSLEDFRIAFAVTGASRTCTHQLVRSRRAAFHQQSQRAHYYGDLPSVRMPESFLKHRMIKQEFEELAEHAAAFYRLACDHDISYQDARFALLEGTTNFILCEYSLAEFIAVYEYRACSMFQWEIVAIMRLMREALVEKHPWLDPYVLITCQKTKGALDHDLMMHKIATDHDVETTPGMLDHTCRYQGWEEVEPQCDFPWARDTNRSFRSDHHRIEAKKNA